MKTIDMKRTLQMHLEEDEKLIRISILTFNSLWNILIGIQIYMEIILMTYVLAYNHKPSIIVFIMFFCDIFYLFDFIGSLIYVKSWKTLRFLPYAPKNWKFIVLDFISLIPLGYGYETYVSENQINNFLYRSLLQNRCLRGYKIYFLFNFYDLTVRNIYQYLLLMIIKFLIFVSLVVHIVACIWYNIPNEIPCTNGFYECLIWREMSIFEIVTHNWSGKKSAFGLPEEKILVILIILCGVYLIYGDLVPHLLLIFLKIARTNGRFYQIYQKLERFLKNVGVDRFLNERVEKYFNHFWLSDTTGKETKDLMTELPIALRKEIFTDIYWDAFQHSDLFRDVSRCCKRSLSLVMTTEYCQEGDIVWEKGSYKNKMIYLVEGVIELMAEENETSPIMSFSTGTILGEMSLFSTMKSLATIKCRTICELHTLSLRHVYPILLNYPEDRKIIFQKLNKRMAIAKITQWRKKRINVMQVMDFDLVRMQMLTSNGNEDTVKWVKMQWRAIWELHERHMLVLRAQEGGLRIPAWRRQYELQGRLDMISNYMDLMVLSDIFEEKKDVVCLKTTIPWAIEPNVEFLQIWRIIIIITAILSSLIYPFCCGWVSEIPREIVLFSIATSIIFEIDLALLLMTAVKTKHGIITEFGSILLNSVKKPTFYMDIIAALPLNIYHHYINKYNGNNYFLLLSVLKAHVFFRPRSSYRESMIFVCIIKNVFFFLLLIYWYAAILQLTSNRCFPVCGFLTWDNSLVQYLDDFTRENLLSVYLAASISLCLQDDFFMKNAQYLITKVLLCIFFFFLWICWFLGDFYTVYSIKLSNQLQFMILYNRIMRYLENVQITHLVQKRIVRIVRFQWLYNKADDILTKTSSITLAPKSIRREIYINTIYKTLRKCPLFQDESLEFIYDNIERSEIIAVPSGTILVNYGFRCNRIHLLHKGYCQANSFLENDVTGGLAAPILIKPGNIFPSLETFASIPPPITVLTLTDCIIVVFQLEDILKSMISHNIFNDLIMVLKNSNLLDRLSHHTFAMIQMNVQFNAPIDEKEEYEKPFRSYGCLGSILKRIIFHKDIFFDKNQKPTFFYNFISILYVGYLIIMIFLWPLIFGLLIYQFHYIIPILAVGKISVFIYIYLKFHIPYFDKRGLLIKHPLYTIGHYFTTNFLLDAIMHAPIYAIYHLYFQFSRKNENNYVVFITIFQKLLFLIPINRYFTTINNHNSNTLLNRTFYVVIIFTAVVNAAVNYDVFLSVNWTFDNNGRVVGFKPRGFSGMSDCRSRDNDNIVKYFVTTTFWLFGHLTGNSGFCQTFYWKAKIYALVCSFIGTVIAWIFFGLLAASSAISDTHMTLYQERMKSFIDFLMSSKTKDKIVEKSISFFEHQWSRSRGQNLREICEGLPHHLHEELAYPLYRPTLHKVALFADADESFYGLLSTKLDLVHYNRGSVILSRGQVQSDIFFVHRGKCFVFDWFLTLDLGSMIGDLSHTGRTVNRIFALTHIELLRIDSNTFFQLINNYYAVEKRFLSKAVTSENFIKSYYVQPKNQLRPVDSRDVLNAFNLQNKDLGFEDQSYFEDLENMMEKTFRQTKHIKKRFNFTIYPGTFLMFIYNAMNFIVALVTMITMPNFLFFGGLTSPVFVVTAILDGIWAIGVFATFRVGIEDKIKGDVITSGKYIAKTYLLAWDGFFLRLISCLPFELILILYSDTFEDIDKNVLAGLRSLRLLRVYFLIKYLIKEVNKLKVSSITRYMIIIFFYILYLHIMVLTYYLVVSKEEIVEKMTPLELDSEQGLAILLVYHFVLNISTATNMSYLIPETMAEIIYFNTFSVLSIYAKGLIIKYMLTIKYVHSLARGTYKNQITLLETFLKRCDLSPSILKEVLDYKQNLLIYARSENNPTFLRTAPASLRIAIMSDLYLDRLKKSPIFREVSTSFLELLVCRLKRQIFFPGQKIVEKGDVDNTMYFIHDGEVYVVDQTNDEAYIEFVVDKIFAGDEFGHAQGLTLATPHKNTYRARTIVEVITLRSKDWIDLKHIFPHIYQQIIETLNKTI